MLKLKFSESEKNSHPGYGAGSGDTIREEYICPCGNGKVIYEKDDIPGFKDTSIFTDCESCREKYDFGRGTATEK